MSNQESNIHDVIVIGAGIIGISCALKLQQQGHKVLVLDRIGVAAETSAGNAGAFAFSEIIPLATPGIMSKAPKWLLDPLGPLSIPPSYALKIIPWMLKFWRASQPDRYQASVTAQMQMMNFSKDALDRQVAAVEGEKMLRPEGQLQLYQGEKEFKATLDSWQLRKEQGVKFELLESPEAIAKIQPNIDSSFTHGAFTPEWRNICDPKEWTEFLADAFMELGGKIEQADIVKVETQGNIVTVKDQYALWQSKKLVVAAGAWSKAIIRHLGDDAPLETERGYNTTLPEQKFELKTHVSFSNHGFVVSKIGRGIRVGGAVELGGLKLKPNYKRSEALLNKAAKFLPGLKITGGVQWMGFRPSMPDTLPVISPSTKFDNVVYAFGHGHLGLTQSAGTAEIVTDLIEGKEPKVDIKPFAIGRF